MLSGALRHNAYPGGLADADFPLDVPSVPVLRSQAQDLFPGVAYGLSGTRLPHFWSPCTGLVSSRLHFFVMIREVGSSSSVTTMSWPNFTLKTRNFGFSPSQDAESPSKVLLSAQSSNLRDLALENHETEPSGLGLLEPNWGNPAIRHH